MKPNLKQPKFKSPFMEVSSMLYSNYYRIDICSGIVLYHHRISALKEGRSNPILGEFRKEQRDVRIGYLTIIPSGFQYNDIRSSWYARMFNV